MCRSHRVCLSGEKWRVLEVDIKESAAQPQRVRKASTMWEVMQERENTEDDNSVASFFW